MLAIIPARGGSKGLPGKNIKSLNGKPLIAYTIEAALKSNLISRIIVSTDDEEIASVSKDFGAEVPFLRPKELASDTAKSLDVFLYTLRLLEHDEGAKIDNVAILQPTSPLRTSVHLDESILLFHEKAADSVISYCEEHHPIFWHKFIDSGGKFLEIFDGDFLKNRQEVPRTYFPNGAIYVFKSQLLFDGKYYNNNSFAYLMDRTSSLDIDCIEDFEYAEFLMQKKQ